jgi:hypothetical protein
VSLKSATGSLLAAAVKVAYAALLNAVVYAGGHLALAREIIAPGGASIWALD